MYFRINFYQHLREKPKAFVAISEPFLFFASKKHYVTPFQRREKIIHT
jgi:hypothetical protein